MVTVILLILTAVCAIGWLCYWVSFAALTMYMIGKEYTLPSDSEIRECMKEVVLRLFKLKH